MNEYRYADISIGDSESFTVTITAEMIDEFSALTGDCNPLHTDTAFANAAGYKRRVCHGMLTASFISALAGVYLPGRHSLIHKSEVSFPNPVFEGDIITFSGRVVDKNDEFRFIEIKVIADNNEGKRVLRGKMRVGVLA